MFTGFKDSVGAVAVSIDKQTLAVGALDGSLELRPLQPLPKFSMSAIEELVEAQKHGKILEKGGKWPEAVEHYRKHAALAQEATGRLGEFTTIMTDCLGQALVMVDQPAQGTEEMQRALDVWETLPGHEDVVAPSAIVLGVIYRDLGELAKSATLLKRAVELREKQFGLSDLKTASARYALAMTYYQQGRFDEAKSLMQKSLEVRESKLGPDDRQVALSASGLGAVYAAMGQPEEARPLYLRGIGTLDNGKSRDRLNACNLLNNLAILDAGLGRFEEAEVLLKRCLEVSNKVLGADDIGNVNFLNSLATIYLCTRQFDKAEPLLKRSIELIEKKSGREDLALSTALANLAALNTALGRPGEAVKLLRRALAIKEAKLGADHPDLVMLLYSLGGAEIRLGHVSKAKPLLARALEIAKAHFPADHPLTARCLTDQAVLLGIEGNWDDAVKAADAARRSGGRYASGALSMLSEQEQLKFLNPDGDFGWQFQQAASMAYVRAQDQVVLDASADWVLNGKAVAHRVLSERSLQLREMRDSTAIYLRPKLIPLLQGVRQQLATALFAVPGKEDEARHRARIEYFRQQERDLTLFLGLNERPPDPWIDLNSVRRAIGDAVLIEILKLRPYSFREQDLAGNPWGAPRYVAWVIPAADKGDVRFVDLGDAGKIEAAVDVARQALETPPGPDEPAGEQRSREPIGALSRLVLDPLVAAAGPNAHWIVSPDGDLWLAPWSALTFADGTYAIEKLQIRYLASGRQLVQGRESAPSTGSVVMADPDYDLTESEGAQTSKAAAMDFRLLGPTSRSGDIRAAHWQRLPGTADEARNIVPQLLDLVGSKPRLYLDKQALETEFKQLVRPRILVMSTHGFFLEPQESQTVIPLPPPVAARPTGKLTTEQRGLDLVESDATVPLVVRASRKGAEGLENPLLRCGLVLAGANRRDEASAGGTDDGILTGLEIIATDLRGTDLVVLSACETGLGQVHNGEGVAGLRQAFQLAGAHAVAATLWKIPDKQTTRLIQAFFDELKKNRGADKAEALRQAQLTVIRERRAKGGAAHPYYWAAFTLTGS